LAVHPAFRAGRKLRAFHGEIGRAHRNLASMPNRRCAGNNGEDNDDADGSS
jgi:hypothetical protein